MVRVFIFVAIIASVAAFKAPNSVVVTPAVPKVLELRGGASIGPLTPSLLTKVQCFMGFMYALEMFGLSPATDDAVAKYWGKPGDTVSKGIMKWFGLAIVWSNGLTLYSLLSLGTDAVGLQKFQAFTWASCLVLYMMQVNEGTAVMTEGPIIQAVMTALSTYAGFF